MHDEFPALNAHVGALLLVLNLTILLLGGLLVHHASALRRERRAQAGQLAECPIGRRKTPARWAFNE